MILDVKQLSHSFGEKEALTNLNFSIENNSIVSVLGPSGCGKTTLIRLIAGLEQIQKGEIFLEKSLVANKNLNVPPEKRPISYVFQDFALFPHMTVLENVSFAAGSKSNKKQLIDQVIHLAKVENFLEKYPQYLEKVRLVMLSVPSRSNVPEYKKLKKETDEFVGRINGKFATVNWTPFWYYYRSMDFENLIDLYVSSDIAMITPLRDGMNLVAK